MATSPEPFAQPGRAAVTVVAMAGGDNLTGDQKKGSRSHALRTLRREEEEGNKAKLTGGLEGSEIERTVGGDDDGGELGDGGFGELGIRGESD